MGREVRWGGSWGETEGKHGETTEGTEGALHRNLSNTMSG